ncbi:hypothetical protein QY97_03493 [Bacillus thermotolerans]|nr:hypothetical protein QY97_03493 [Bacillus thermotolerans]
MYNTYCMVAVCLKRFKQTASSMEIPHEIAGYYILIFKECD